MSSVHLRLEGGWQQCAEPDSCALLHHVHDMSVAEATTLPWGLLEPLLEVVEPPVLSNLGTRLWYDENLLLHREYDLPARINSAGVRSWFYRGELHRGHDRPAVVYADGGMEWWRNGKLHRDRGPAIVYPDHAALNEYYRHGDRYHP